MKIDLIVIKTNQPDVVANFYSLLGIVFDYHNHGNGPFHYAAKVNETVFEIYPLPKNIDKPDNTLRLGLTVTGLDDIIEDLKINGVRIVQPLASTEWGYQAVVED